MILIRMLPLSKVKAERKQNYSIRKWVYWIFMNYLSINDAVERGSGGSGGSVPILNAFRALEGLTPHY